MHMSIEHLNMIKGAYATLFLELIFLFEEQIYSNYLPQLTQAEAKLVSDL